MHNSSISFSKNTRTETCLASVGADLLGPTIESIFNFEEHLKVRLYVQALTLKAETGLQVAHISARLNLLCEPMHSTQDLPAAVQKQSFSLISSCHLTIKPSRYHVKTWK